MSCCGQKRQALVHGRVHGPVRSASAMGASIAASMPATVPRRGDVMLRYVGPGAFSTRSLRTGRVYVSAGMDDGVPVDPRDAESLLRTRLFARA